MSEAAHIQFILSVVKHASVIGVNWNRCAEENGIGYARNCAIKFKDIVKQYGYTFQQNQLVRTEDALPEIEYVPKPKKAARKPRVTKPKAAPRPVAKKRKVQKTDDSDSEVKSDSDAKSDELMQA